MPDLGLYRATNGTVDKIRLLFPEERRTNSKERGGSMGENGENKSKTRDGRPTQRGRGVGERVRPDEQRQPKCAAYTNKSGKRNRCRNYALPGTTVCKQHGGYLALATKGPAHPAYRDGRYSRSMNSESMKSAYDRALGANDPFSHKDEIALMTILIEEELAHVGQDAGMQSRMWSEVNGQMTEFERALIQGDRERQQEAFLDMRDTVRRGMRDAEARMNVRRMAQERASLADKETRRVIALRNVMTADQAHALFERIMFEINKNVTNAEDRVRLNEALLRIGGGLEERASQVAALDSQVQ